MWWIYSFSQGPPQPSNEVISFYIIQRFSEALQGILLSFIVLPILRSIIMFWRCGGSVKHECFITWRWNDRNSSLLKFLSSFSHSMSPARDYWDPSFVSHNSSSASHPPRISVSGEVQPRDWIGLLWNKGRLCPTAWCATKTRISTHILQNDAQHHCLFFPPAQRCRSINCRYCSMDSRNLAQHVSGTWGQMAWRNDILTWGSYLG